MRIARILLAGCTVLIAACSSSGDDTSSDTSSDSSAAPVTDTQTEPVDSAASEETTPPPTEATPATEPVESEGSNSSDDAPADTTAEDPLLINGPAEVRPTCASLDRGVSNLTLDAGGAVHDVRIYVPENVTSDPVATVLNWHGLGSNGPDQAAFTGYEALAETEGFVVVHATGVDGGAGANSWELTQFDTPERDDLAFADALIDLVVSEWCADPTRIYSTGMSNGGLFTSELVCNRAGRIAAAASVAGTSHAPSCDPERAVPYIAFHGTADNVVPFDAADPSVLLPSEGVAALMDESTPGEFAEFAVDAGCDPEPTRVEETAEVIRFDYTGCADGVPMAFYEIVGGGHTWPSSPRADELEGYGYFTQDIDATGDAWAFMSQFSL